MNIKKTSFKEKSDFVINYFYDNYSTTKEQFLNQLNITEELLFKQLYSHSLIYCQYILITLDLKEPYILFPFVFDQHKIDSQPFLVIKGLSDDEINFIKENQMNQQEIESFFCNSIRNKNEFLSLIPEFNMVDFSINSLKNNIDSLYELIHLKQHLLNF